MPSFVDILATLALEVEGEKELQGVADNFERTSKAIDAAEKKVKGLKTAIKNTDSAAKKMVLESELKKSERQLDKLNNQFKQSNGLLQRLDRRAKDLQLKREFAESEKEIKAINRQLSITEGKIKRPKTTGAIGGSSAGNSLIGLGGLAAVGGGILGGAVAADQVFDLGEKSIETRAKLEALQNAITFASGSAEEGAKSYQFLIDRSNELGTNFEATAEGFQNVAAAAKANNFEIGQTRKIYSQILVGASALNLSTEDTSGLFLALSQILSKGKVQAEELRGQIGERLPGAFAIAAKALGQSTAELSKNLELGNVYANDFVPKFAKAIEEEFTPALEKSTKSLRANLNRLDNEITLLFGSLGETIAPATAAVAGELAGFAKEVRLFLDLINDPESQTKEFKNQLDQLNRLLGTLKTVSFEVLKAVAPIFDLPFAFSDVTAGLAVVIEETIKTTNGLVDAGRDVLNNLGLASALNIEIEPKIANEDGIKVKTEELLKKELELLEAEQEVSIKLGIPNAELDQQIIDIQKELSRRVNSDPFSFSTTPTAGAKPETAAEKKAKDAAAKREKAAAEKRKKAIKTATDQISDAIKSQQNAIAAIEQKGGKETVERIEAQAEAQRAAEIEKIDKIERDLVRKLKDVPESLKTLLVELRANVDERFTLKAEKDIAEFLKKQQKLISAFNEKAVEEIQKIELGSLELSAGDSLAADEAILAKRFEIQQAALEKRQAAEVAKAAEIGANVEALEAVFELERQNNLAQFTQDRLQLSQDYFDRSLAQLAAANDSEIAAVDRSEIRKLVALRASFEGGLISKEVYESRKTEIQRLASLERIALEEEEIKRQIAAVAARTTQDLPADELKSLNAELGKLQNQLSEIRGQKLEIGSSEVNTALERATKQQRKLSEFAQVYRTLSDAAGEAATFAINREVEKNDRLISLQKERVDAAQRIAAQGNAEALQREKATLDTLIRERERAAKKQRAINAALAAANYALAISEGILAISKSAAEGGGVASPFLVASTVAGLIAGGIALISQFSSFQDETQFFNKGTDFVKGKRGIDKVPAMLTYGERVTDAKTNAEYGKSFDFLEKKTISPSEAMKRLQTPRTDYRLLQKAYFLNKEVAAKNRTAIREMENKDNKIIISELRALNENIEILLNDNTNDSRISNAGEVASLIARALKSDHKWEK